MNQYYLELNVHTYEVIKPEWIIPRHSKIETKPALYANLMLKNDFLKKLKTISDISGILIFNKHDEVFNTAHIDIGRSGETYFYRNYALNFVFDTSTHLKSTMNWFSLLNNNQKKEIEYTEANTPYLDFCYDELKLEEEFCITDKVSLVRTNVPHSITSGNGHRTCVSIRFRNNDEWDVAYKRFNEVFNLSIC